MSMLRPSSLKLNMDTSKMKEMLNDTAEASDSEKKIVNDMTEENCCKDNANILKKNCPNVIVTSLPLSKNSTFVFGENIHERVIGDNIHKLHASSSTKSNDLLTNSKVGMLFSTALNQIDSQSEARVPQETDMKSLSEVARVYEESRAQKRKYEEVETFTGEEEEINIIELNCKLFAFINGNWEERGRGTLRLNDAKDGSYSRVVFRSSGNLRLLLNTKIWSEMILQRPSTKSVRITAMDSMNQVKIFLMMSRPDDITLIYNALFERINSCSSIKVAPEEQNENTRTSNSLTHEEPCLKKKTVDSK